MAAGTRRETGRQALWLIVAALTVGMLTGCATSRGPAPGAKPKAAPTGVGLPERTPRLPAAPQGAVERALREEYEAWRGTPYRYGGEDLSGADCSGFVQAVFSGLFGVELPRTTAEQVHAGAAVDRSRLEAGDLVFFQLDRKGRHVGIYLDGDEFVHASTSQGVTISRMTDPYWQARYWLSRRVLSPQQALDAGAVEAGTSTAPDEVVAERPAAEPPVVRSSPPPAERPSRRRVGW